MNLIRVVEEGIEGVSPGLLFHIDKLNILLGGIHKHTMHIIAAEPKAGKTTFLDENYVLSPYLRNLLVNPDTSIEWYYWSTEISRIEKEAGMISTLLYYNHGLRLTAEYILGRQLVEENGRIVRKIVSAEHHRLIVDTYLEYIVPLFGTFDADSGRQLTSGLIRFFPKDNPTGIRNELLRAAAENGEMIRETYQIADENGVMHSRERIVSYRPNNRRKYILCLIDHLRGLKRERGFSMKDNIDKMTEYAVELRNLTGIIFAFTIHLNRAVTDIDRLKYLKDTLYPHSDDLKDSGNPSEDANYVFTMLNASDEKYGITTHFGHNVRSYEGRYRSLHLVAARNAECPVHMGMEFLGDVKHFEYLPPRG